jgi:hypothetical protein
VSVDWRDLPPGESTGTVSISQTNGDTVTVQVKAIKRPAPTPGSFVEADGYVSIEAEHFSENRPGRVARWERIPGYGRTLSAMSVFPVDSTYPNEPGSAPCLEYRLHLYSKGRVNVDSIFGPTLAFQPSRGIRCAVAFDNERPTICSIPAPYLSPDWETSVKDSVRVIRTIHQIASTGPHVMKIWALDPGVVLEKLIVAQAGVLRPSYLGPPESLRSSDSVKNRAR